MTHEQMKNVILFRYHKNIDYWYKLLGEMFEGTEEFTKPYEKKCTLDGKSYCISWNNDGWNIN